jgi:DNA-binding CsgD family transcriptional regulator
LAVIEPGELEPLLAASVPAPVSIAAAALTARELDVLRLVAEGDANKEIAWKLGISEHTAKFHVASILGKLSAGSRTEAVTIGIRRGLVLI